MEHGKPALRTRIYVDGFNLYHGCLKRTSYKWLDLMTLFRRVLHDSGDIIDGRTGQTLNFVLADLAIKYFTAPILKNFAKAPDSVPSQISYHSALEAHLGGAIEFVRGYYAANSTRAYRFERGRKPHDCELVEIWKLEEKQSDVALALHAYSDAIRGEVDCAIFVTNDTDIAPALELMANHTAVTIGLIVPARDAASANGDLVSLAHWTRSHILEKELAASQMPPMVLCTSGPAHKPLTWYPRFDLLEPIYIEAKRVKRSHGAALKWLNTPCSYLGGRRPMEMAETDAGAAELRAYMDAYTEQVMQKGGVAEKSVE